MIGGAERRLDIAEAQLLVVVFVVILEVVARVGLVDDGRAGLERLLDVEHRGQRVVVDATSLAARHGCRLALGDDGHDRLALVAHLVDGQQRLVVLAEIDQAEQRVLVDAARPAPRITRLTPGARSAADTSMPRMRA